VSRARSTSGALVPTIFTSASGHQEGPSRHSAEMMREGPCAYGVVGTLTPGAKKGNPKVALSVSALDVATGPAGVQPA